MRRALEVSGESGFQGQVYYSVCTAIRLLHYVLMHLYRLAQSACVRATKFLLRNLPLRQGLSYCVTLKTSRAWSCFRGRHISGCFLKLGPDQRDNAKAVLL